MEKKITVKGKSLSEAKKKLIAEIPKGFFLVSMKNFEPTTNTTKASFGYNTDEAIINAKKVLNKKGNPKLIFDQEDHLIKIISESTILEIANEALKKLNDIDSISDNKLKKMIRNDKILNIIKQN